MARRRRDLERDVARVVDPFSEAARSWSAREAERRRGRAAVDRESFAIGHRRIAGDDGRHPVGPLVRELERSTTPEHYFRVGGDRIPGGPPADPPRESVLDMLSRRRRELYGEEYRHIERPRSPPAQDAAHAVREREHARSARARYEAGRPPRAPREGVGMSAGSLPVAVTHNAGAGSRAGAFWRGVLHRVSPPPRSGAPPTVAEIEREIRKVSQAGRRSQIISGRVWWRESTGGRPAWYLEAETTSGEVSGPVGGRAGESAASLGSAIAKRFPELQGDVRVLGGPGGPQGLISLDSGRVTGVRIWPSR